MGLEIVPINSSFEDYQALYEEWFNYVDAGFNLHSLLS